MSKNDGFISRISSTRRMTRAESQSRLGDRVSHQDVAHLRSSVRNGVTRGSNLYHDGGLVGGGLYTHNKVQKYHAWLNSSRRRSEVFTVRTLEEMGAHDDLISDTGRGIVIAQLYEHFHPEKTARNTVKLLIDERKRRLYTVKDLKVNMKLKLVPSDQTNVYDIRMAMPGAGEMMKRFKRFVARQPLEELALQAMANMNRVSQG